MYSDTSYDKLGLLLAHRTVDVSVLNIIKNVYCEGSLFNIEVGVLGASHYIKVFRNETNESFSEVFSCAPFKDEGSFYPIKNKLSVKEVVFNRMYEFHSEVLFLDENTELYDSFIKSDLLLKHEFPGPTNTVYKPYTAIKSKKHVEGFEIETMHVYPEQNIVVFTKSKL